MASIPSILTFSGQYFDYTRPEDWEMDIHDIAVPLSRISRFGGHPAIKYTVAEHCVHVASLLPEPLKLAGLLHDAVEAFMGDMPSPLKELIPEFKKLEKRIERVILPKLGVGDEIFDPMIKAADIDMLRVEQGQVMNNRDRWSTPGDLNFPEAAGIKIRFWEETFARVNFIHAYQQLRFSRAA